MSEAVELTGKSQSTLVNICIERSLDAVVAELMDRKMVKVLAFYDKKRQRPK